VPRPWKKPEIPYTEAELRSMSREEVTYELTDKERLFCEYYSKNHNKNTSAIKAGFSSKSAHVVGYKLTQKERCMVYITWLKLKVCDAVHLTAMDIIDQDMRAAFADMADFVDIKNGKLKVFDMDRIDGQLIKSVKQNRDGSVSLELINKESAISRLERYFDLVPKDWRQELEERRLQLLQDKLDLEKAKAGIGGVDIEDDGFLQALCDASEGLWEANEDESESD